MSACGYFKVDNEEEKNRMLKRNYITELMVLKKHKVFLMGKDINHYLKNVACHYLVKKSINENLELPFYEVVKLVQCRNDTNPAVRKKRYGIALNEYLRGFEILYAMPLVTDDEKKIRWGQVMRLYLMLPVNAKALYRKCQTREHALLAYTL